MDIPIVKMIHGSHLYGLNTEKSDMDFKGVFLPSKRSLLIGKALHGNRENTNPTSTKNTSDDVDFEQWSIHRFVKLCLEGQMPAIDMLHGKSACYDVLHPSWVQLFENRDKLHSKQFKGFLGYINSQISKYGVKASRMGAVREMIHYIGRFGRDERLEVAMRNLPQIDHVTIENSIGCNQINIVGRKFQEHTRCGYVTDQLIDLFNKYGNRVREAEQNQNIDWKAVSHAFRCGYAIIEICENVFFEYPLMETDFVMKVKLGEFNWVNDSIPDRLASLVDDCEKALTNSALSDKPDYGFWDEFVFNTYENEQ